MSYCVNCGVELAEYEKKCPLCGTKVINPNSPENFDAEPPYPEYHPIYSQRVSAQSVLTLIAIIFMLPIALCVIIDFSMNHDLLWSGYVICSMFLLYVFISVASLCSKMPLILAQIFDFTAIIIFLLYINYSLGQTWFFTFALPIVAYIAICTILMTVCAVYTNISGLGVTAVSFLLTGLFTILLEILIGANFSDKIRIAWSYYPFIVLSIIAIALLFIDRNKAIKHRLAKKFFI